MVDNFDLLVNESKIQEILSKLQEQFRIVLRAFSSIIWKSFKDERKKEA